jgi:uncharacterized protein
MTHAEQTSASRKIVEDMYAAGSAGDFEGFFARVSTHVVVKEPAFLPYGGTYRGIDEFKALVGKVAAVLDLRTLTVERLIADGDHVVALVRVSTVDGDEVRLSELSIVRDGSVAEMEIFFHDGANLIG